MGEGEGRRGGGRREGGGGKQRLGGQIPHFYIFVGLFLNSIQKYVQIHHDFYF